MIRIVSVTEETTSSSKEPSLGGDHQQIHRKGSVESGDVVREAAGVDLRRPITKFMWSDTVSLLKISPRPVKMIVAKELSNSPRGFVNEVSKSMVQVGAIRSKWGGSLRDSDADADAYWGREEEKREITKIPNMPDSYGLTKYKRPSRSGGTEAVAESIRAMEMDENCVDSESIVEIETDRVGEEEQKTEKEESTSAHSNGDVMEPPTVMGQKDDNGNGEQNEPITNSDVRNGVESETVGEVKERIGDGEQKESLKKLHDNSINIVDSKTPVVVNDDDEEQLKPTGNPDDSNIDNKNNTNAESTMSIGSKDDNNDGEQKEPATKPTDNINILTNINNDAIGDDDATETTNSLTLKPTVNSIPTIFEDSTNKSTISTTETRDETIQTNVTQKTKNARSKQVKSTSSASIDGLSYAPPVDTSSSGESAGENKTYTDMSSYLSLSDCSDSASGIGMLDTPHYPRRKKTVVAEGLVNDDPLYRKEILFVRSEKDNSATLGWTNDLWLAKSPHRVLIYSRHVQLLTKGRFFWSADQYVPRALALYTDPNLLLVLRPPLNISEVKESLNIPDELDLSPKQADSPLTDLYWVAERVIDLHTCKFRLSQLTTPTSVVVPSDASGGGAVSENDEGPITDCRRTTCFELINPTENVLISAVVIPPSVMVKDGDNNGVEEAIYSGKSAISVTTWWESAITKAICAAHAPFHIDENNSASSDKSWKHQIVLGTLHSHVVSGSYVALQRALEIIKQGHSTNDKFSPSKISRVTFLDRFDENGMTALHYACTSRSSSAVSILIKAGADCTLPTKLECKTPCHLSAELLDQTSISVILAASKPRRPDPNALDSYGRTPMYVAVVIGRSVGETGGDPDQLRDCCLEFEDWGGQLYLLPNDIIATSKTRRSIRHKKLTPMDEMSTATNQVKVMPHPIHSVAAEWRHAELETLFDFCPHRYPIDLEGQCGFGRSLGAVFDYPLHACAIALRKKLIEFKQKRRSDMFGQATGEPSLISTLRVLLNHGLEPNERLDYINSATEFALEMNEMIGFTPVQIFAGAALDIITGRQESQDKGLNADPSLEFVSFYVAESVELLIQHGARIAMESPLVARPNRDNPLEDLVLQLLKGGMTSLPALDRGKLNIEKNGDIIGVFGGKPKLNRQRAKWYQAKAVKAPSGCKIPTGKEFPSFVPDFELPGGSDSTNCAICWKSFGLLRNRKHICRLSRRYVCEDCSSKSVIAIEGGGSQSHRVSDGQFTYSKRCSERERGKDRIKLQEKTNARKEHIEKLQGTRHRAGIPTITDDSKREELFSGSAMSRAVRNFFTDGGTGTANDDVEQSTRSGSAEKSAQDQLVGIASSLDQTKDALNERGERLNTLSDKTRALADASSDFASMAKELKKSQEGGGGGLFW